MTCRHSPLGPSPLWVREPGDLLWPSTSRTTNRPPRDVGVPRGSSRTSGTDCRNRHHSAHGCTHLDLESRAAKYPGSENPATSETNSSGSARCSIVSNNTTESTDKSVSESPDASPTSNLMSAAAYSRFACPMASTEASTPRMRRPGPARRADPYPVPQATSRMRPAPTLEQAHRYPRDVLRAERVPEPVGLGPDRRSLDPFTHGHGSHLKSAAERLRR